jgi:hypothetical protein
MDLPTKIKEFPSIISSGNIMADKIDRYDSIASIVAGASITTDHCERSTMN